MKREPMLRAWGFAKERYASADPRSLGAFRMALGLLLFVDVATRIRDVPAHYSNAGWLPNHALLFNPLSQHQFSLHLAFSTPAQVTLLMVVQLVVSTMLIAGYRTRLAQVLSALLITSLNSRNVLLENGGFVAVNLLVVWSMFLPLGRAFSIDALRRGSSPARQAQPVVSLAVTAILLQWFVIYYFNTVHKTGTSWRDGTAVYYFLQDDRMITSWGAALRGSLPLELIRVFTYAALVMEGTIAALLISPFRTPITRMVAWAFVIVLHVSIAVVMDLGPFSWVMMCAFVAFIPASFWQHPRVRVWLAAAGARASAIASRASAQAQTPAESAPAARLLRRVVAGAREGAVLFLMLCVGSQVLMENRAVPDWLKPRSRPEWMTAVVVGPRLFQGWTMFAPNPPRRDGKVVVVARTVDGRTVDPLTGAEPDFDLNPRGGFGLTAAWSDFHGRIAEPRFAHLLPGVVAYIWRYPERTGRPADRLLGFEIWYAEETVTPPGQPPLPPVRRMLAAGTPALPQLLAPAKP